MKVFKRSIISIFHQFKKSLLFFFVILILSGLVIGSFSVRNAIENIQHQNSLILPPFATVVNRGLDFDVRKFEELHGINPFEILLTNEMIDEIIQLPKVYSFEHRLDFSMWISEWEKIDYFQLYTFERLEDDPVTLSFVGVNNYLPLAFDSGNMELISGRPFTDEDFLNEAYVIIIPETLAIANNFSIGDKVVFDNFNEDFLDENSNLSIDVYEFEIIGIFRLHNLPNSRQGTDFWTSDESFIHELANRVYLPMSTARRIHTIQNRLWNPTDPLIDDTTIFEGTLIFQLQHPSDLPMFIKLANEILPPYLIMRDFSHNYSDLTSVLTYYDEFVFFIQIGSFSMAILILSLTVIWLILERKREIGIYLSLGEKKKNIYIQFLFEKGILSVFAIILAYLGVSFFIHDFFENFLLSEFIHTLSERHIDLNVRPLESAGFFHSLTYSDMIDAFQINFSFTDILGMTGIILLPILITILIFLCSLMKKDLVFLNRG